MENFKIKVERGKNVFGYQTYYAHVGFISASGKTAQDAEENVINKLYRLYVVELQKIKNIRESLKSIL